MKQIALMIFLISFKLDVTGIEYFTTGHDAYTGWDIYQNDHISFGIPNYPNSIGGYQHKIHDADGGFTDNLEFFCDPDDIVYIKSAFGKQTKYISYLPVKQDVFLNNEKTFFRASFLTEIKLVNDLNQKKIDIRIDKSFKNNDKFITNTIYIHNQSQSTVDVAWIAQDAAYMSFKDNSQKNVLPYSKLNSSLINTNFFSEINVGDRVGTEHTRELIVGSYSPLNKPKKCKIYGGVVNEYAFFVSHSMNEATKQQYPYGYADISKSGYNDIKGLLNYFSKKRYNLNQLQNRMIIYECNDINPGEKIILQYSQTAETIKEE